MTSGHPSSVAAPGKPVRVLLIEDYELAAHAMATTIESAGWQVLGPLRSRAELRLNAERWSAVGLQPDVAVTDLRLPDTRGVQVVEDLVELRRRQWSRLRIVVHSRSSSGRDVMGALECGADTFLAKGEEPDLTRAIARVLAGRTDVGLTLAAFLLSERTGLSRRQREVLELLTQGFTNAEIGRSLGISERTVENHLRAIRGATDIDGQPGSSVRVKLANWWRGDHGG